MTKLPNRRPFHYLPPEDPLDILYHDQDVLIVNKPSGLLSVPGKTAEHSDCLESRAQAQFPSAKIVHRLDMDTSGVMVLGLTPQAHSNLSLQFERRQTEKIYIARLWERVEGDEGLINLPLRCDWPNRPVQMVDHVQGRPAQTRWQVIEREKQATRVKLFPLTGRSHQLRVHMLEIGHPILGDNFYAHDSAFHMAERLQLHAQSLLIFHPRSRERLTFSAPCPF